MSPLAAELLCKFIEAKNDIHEPDKRQKAKMAFLTRINLEAKSLERLCTELISTVTEVKKLK